MPHPDIEAIVEELRKKFPVLADYSDKRGERLLDLLRSALTSLRLRTLDEAVGCIPEESKLPEGEAKAVTLKLGKKVVHLPQEMMQDAQYHLAEVLDAWNSCRAATLQALSHLKGEPTK